MTVASLLYEKNSVDRGYTDRILYVDLDKKELSVENVPEETRRMFVGGRGYCLKLVFDGTDENTRSDSPENVLAFAGGPFCGESGFAGTGKFIVGAISPLTQTFCDSNVGGYFFPLVKQAGFDAIAVTGKSEQDVVVIIDGDRGEIRIEAAPDRECGIADAEDLIDNWKGESPPANVAFISSGLGARNTNFGCINSVYYDVPRKRCRAKQAGRGGLGTVMRDKGLWAVVVKYDRSKGLSNQPADRDRVRSAGKALRQVIKEVDPTHMRLAWQGTTTLLDMMNAKDLLPVNNYQYGSDEREPAVSGTIFESRVFEQKKPDGCFAGCNLACTKGCEEHTLTTGPLAGKTVAVDGPEYETSAAVTNLGIFDIDSMLEYAWYCDEYGIDTISVGVVISFLCEAFERGYLTKEDTGGVALEWSDTDTVMALIHSMAAGDTPFAREVGRGLRHMKSWIAQRAAGRNGKPEDKIVSELARFGMECKGLEFSMYITKESLAQQGGYGFALKGPQHDEAWLIFLDQVNNEMPTFEQKATALKWFPLFRTWFNIVGLCKLPWIDVRHPEAKNTGEPAKNLPTIAYYLDFVNGTLGTEKTIDDLLEESERCYLLHKLINLRQGFGTRQHDLIPLRAMAPVFMNEFESRKSLYLEQLKEIGVDINGKNDDALLASLQEYRTSRYQELMDVVYQEKGYDTNSIPTDETLKRLGMDSPMYLDIVKTVRSRPAEK